MLGSGMTSDIQHCTDGWRGIGANQISANIVETQRRDNINLIGRTKTENIKEISMILSAYVSRATENMTRFLRESVSNVQSHSNHLRLENTIAQNNATQNITGNDVEPVYNLKVEDESEFFANGILVHNCDAFVYLIMALAKQGMEKQEIVFI